MAFQCSSEAALRESLAAAVRSDSIQQANSESRRIVTDEALWFLAFATSELPSLLYLSTRSLPIRLFVCSNILSFDCLLLLTVRAEARVAFAMRVAVRPAAENMSGEEQRRRGDR